MSLRSLIVMCVVAPVVISPYQATEGAEVDVEKFAGLINRDGWNCILGVDDRRAGPAIPNVDDRRYPHEIRIHCARRLGAMLHCDAIPTLLKNSGLSPIVWDEGDEFPCRDALKHLGGAAVVGIARHLADKSRRYERGLSVIPSVSPQSYLLDSPFLSDVATHLEGLAVEAREPSLRARLRVEIVELRKMIKYRATAKQITLKPYPMPLPYTPSQFDEDLEESSLPPEKVHRVGGELMRILQDGQKPVPDRVRAARLLGKLQYVLAIPLLADQVELVDPEDENNVPKRHPLPCAFALENFGVCAALEIAGRIAKATSVNEVRRWKAHILDADTLRATITHLRGLAVEATDPDRRDQLHNYVRILSEDDDDAPRVESSFRIEYLAVPIAALLGYVCGRRVRSRKAQVPG